MFGLSRVFLPRVFLRRNQEEKSGRERDVSLSHTRRDVSRPRTSTLARVHTQ
jgi:hypothetical protein